MDKDEMKNKYTERAKIFQQAMESCKSSSPMDCIEWFADRIADLEKENAKLKEKNKWYSEQVCNKECAEVWGQLTKAKDHIKKLLGCLQQDTNDPQTNYYVVQYMTEAEQFLNEVEK